MPLDQGSSAFANKPKTPELQNSRTSELQNSSTPELRSLSIIVVTLNEERHIHRLKQAIDNLERPEGYNVETILVDGGSTDGTRETAGQVGFTKVVNLPGASIPVCRNKGLEMATGDLIAFFDGDCQPMPNWLFEALPFFPKESAKILGWPVIPPEPRTWVQNAWHAHWSHKNAHYEEWNGRQVIRQEAFRLITTRNMIMNRKAVERVDCFDEKLETGEDTDFVFRASHAGVVVVAVPALRVIHYGEPDTLRQFFRQQLWHSNRRSYRRIAENSGLRSGGNAVYYSVAFTLATGCALIGLLTAMVAQSALPLLLVLSLPIVVGAPALLTTRRTGQPGLFFPLFVLYGAYGLARMLDLLGWSKRKESWKRKMDAGCEMRDAE